MSSSKYLLTAPQMARFVVDGFIMFEQLVPQEINAEMRELQSSWRGGGGYQFWHDNESIRKVFELPQVKGILQSFVGERPVYDHSFMHIVPAQHKISQYYHADSVIDTRPFAFDIQAFYFSHDTPLEMGPTLVLPGSHLRKVSCGSIGRYKNILGQRQLACKAGTIVFMHHGIWHCGQPNYTDENRYVFKLRLRPGQQQRNLFQTDGYDSQEIAHIFGAGYQPWVGEEGRVEHINRAKLWRYLVGNDSVDMSFEGVLTRMSL